MKIMRDTPLMMLFEKEVRKRMIVFSGMEDYIIERLINSVEWVEKLAILCTEENIGREENNKDNDDDVKLDVCIFMYGAGIKRRNHLKTKMGNK